MNYLMNLRYVTDVQTVSTKNLILPKSMVSADSIISSNDTLSNSLRNPSRAATINSEQLWPHVAPWHNLGKFPSTLYS